MVSSSGCSRSYFTHDCNKKQEGKTSHGGPMWEKNGEAFLFSWVCYVYSLVYGILAVQWVKNSVSGCMKYTFAVRNCTTLWKKVNICSAFPRVKNVQFLWQRPDLTSTDPSDHNRGPGHVYSLTAETADRSCNLLLVKWVLCQEWVWSDVSHASTKEKKNTLNLQAVKFYTLFKSV